MYHHENHMRKLKNNELKRLSVDTFKISDKTPIVVILDNIRSANNIGSVFRTADAFLISKLYLCGISSTPPNKDIHKTALGAQDSVEWEYCKETCSVVETLQKDAYKVYAIEQVEDSISLETFSPSKNQKIALVFGNEVKGVSQDVVNMCDGSIEIPQYGTKHSLNISVSFGIVIWDIFSKMGKKP